MPWQELRIVVPATSLDALSDALFGLGCGGTHEDWLPGEAPAPRQPWDTGPPAPLPARRLLRAYFEDPDRDAILLALAEAGLSGTWAPVPETDWDEAWRASFPPIEVSPRFTIAPPWDPRPGAVLIEPGQGFGTGQHPTTRGILAALDRFADGSQRTALDVGCGSGILTIAAAKIGLEARGIDIEESAIRDARKNAELNGVSVDFSTAAIRDAAPADLVLANLHAELLVLFADDLVRLTGSVLLMAGILVDREEKVVDAYKGRLTLVERTQDGEWVGMAWLRSSRASSGSPPR